MIFMVNETKTNQAIIKNWGMLGIFIYFKHGQMVKQFITQPIGFKAGYFASFFNKLKV